MELLIRVPYLVEGVMAEPVLSKKDIQEIEKNLGFGDKVKVREKNIGPGADLFVLTVLITLGVWKVFTSGETIEKNLEAWLKIAKRIKGLKRKSELVSVDKEAAAILAIDFISKYENLDSIFMDDFHEINFVQVDGMIPDGRKPNELISKPHGYYVFTFVTNIEKYYIIGVNSNGNVNLIKSFVYGHSYGNIEIGKKSNSKKKA